jgi:hypothetical protein
VTITAWQEEMERGAISSDSLMAMVGMLEGVRTNATRSRVVHAIEVMWARQKYRRRATPTQVGALTLTRGMEMWVVAQEGD